MDTETLKIFYSGIKGYTMLLTNLLDGNAQDFEYIMDKKLLKMAGFGLSSCILLAVKENVVEGTTDNFESKVFYNNLLESVNFIATKKADGYYIDNYKFKDAASVVGELRNKIAHGAFTLDLESDKVTIYMDDDDPTKTIKISIDKLCSMIVSCLKSCLRGTKKNTYKRELLVSNKLEKNREKPFKDKNELLRFANTFRIKSVTLRSKDGSKLDPIITNYFDAAVEWLLVKHSTEKILYFEKVFGKHYAVDIKQERINFEVLESAVNEMYINIDEKMSYNYQANLLSEIIEIKRRPRFNLINSMLNNLLIIIELNKTGIKDKKTTIENLRKAEVTNFISYNELVASSIALFESIFSYGNDKTFKNANEYSNAENTGLNYENLDLSKINVLYIESDDGAKNEIQEKINGKNREIADIDKRIAKESKNLEKVKLKGNTKAINTISAIVAGLENKKQQTRNDIIPLATRLNEIITYEQTYKDRLTNRAIINAIRNCISHGNYELETSKNNDIKIVFEDIYKGKLTFKCEIDIIDFINMIYENQNIIIAFLNKNEQKLVRTKKS